MKICHKDLSKIPNLVPLIITEHCKVPNLKYCTMEMVVLEAAVGACAPVVGYRDSVSVYSCRAPVGPVHGVFIRTAVIGHSTVDEREDAGYLVKSCTVWKLLKKRQILNCAFSNYFVSFHIFSFPSFNLYALFDDTFFSNFICCQGLNPGELQ